MASDTVIGLIGIFLCVLMWGSNYVPVKRHKTHDGMLFLWYQCSGSMAVATMVAVFIDYTEKGNKGTAQEKGLQVPWEGLLAGTMYVIPLAMFPHTIKYSGLAIGFVVWSGTALIVGWAISRFGLFGSDYTLAKNKMLDFTGIILSIISLIFMLFVKPDLTNKKKKKKEESSLNPGGFTFGATALDFNQLDDLNEYSYYYDLTKSPTYYSQPQSPSIISVKESNISMLQINTIPGTPQSGKLYNQWFTPQPTKHSCNSPKCSIMTPPPKLLLAPKKEKSKINVTKSLKESKKSNKSKNLLKLRVIGIVMSFIQGIFSGCVNLPFLWWKKDEKEFAKSSKGYLHYSFSFCLGMYFGSTILFMLMGLFKKLRKTEWKKPVTRPAFISGFLWGIGYNAFLLAISKLPFPIAYVISQIGSIALSSIWSLLYFKEITLLKSQFFIGLSLLLIFGGIVCIACAGTQ